MRDENQAKTGRLGISEMIDRAILSEPSMHFGNAFREILLAMRSVVDAAIENRERKAEAKLQKVTVE